MPVGNRKRIYARGTRHERIRERRGTTLEDLSITERTRRLYFYFTQRVLHLVQKATDEADLDDRLSEWVERKWMQGSPLFDVNATLCGLQHFLPWSKKKLPRSWKLFKTWRTTEVPQRVPPLPERILYSWVNFCVDNSDLYFAACLLLGYDGLLRTGELLQIRPCDMLIKGDQVLLHLSNTKTSVRRGADEVVIFYSLWTALILQETLELADAQGRRNLPLWNRSPQAFRKHFRRYLRKWDMERLGFRPYSLRRGGATNLFTQCRSYDLITQRGRWNSVKASRVYVQEALSQLPLLLLPAAAQTLIDNYYPFWSTLRVKFWVRGRSLMRKDVEIIPAGGCMWNWLSPRRASAPAGELERESLNLMKGKLYFRTSLRDPRSSRQKEVKCWILIIICSKETLILE